MRKNLLQKKIIMVLVAAALCLVINPRVILADDNHGVSEMMPKKPNETDIQPFGLGKPDKDQIYNNSVWVDMEGEAEVSELFSNKWFYQVKQITLVITNNSDKTLTIYLVDDSLLFDSAQKATVAPNSSTQIYFKNLKANTYYCIKYMAPSDFTAQGWGFPQN